MELFERGILNLEDTEGIELSFGNSEILEEMVSRVAHRKGIGDKLAEGSLRYARSYKHPEYSMTVKGLEIPAYDPRASFTQALGYMTSPIGACHLRGGYAVSLAFFGGTREIPRFSLLQSPIAAQNLQNLGILQDSLGICRFTGFAFSMDPWARIASGITGLNFSTSGMEEIANRIAALERIFNLKAGMEYKDDTLPDRFSNEPILIQGEEQLISIKSLEKMRSEYYQVREWDSHGRPSKDLMKALNLDVGEI
jgi:aldehyde:ferredoxin oxidoreductase